MSRLFLLFLLAVFIISSPSIAQVQTTFDSVMNEVYLNYNNKEKAGEYIRTLEKMVKKEDSLKTIANYYILANLYTTVLSDSTKQKEYLSLGEKMVYGGVSTNEFIDISRKISQTGDINYLKKIYKEKVKDPKSFSMIDYSIIAMNFERLGDFETARKLYEKDLLERDLKDPSKLLGIYSHLNFFIKTGEYQKAENYIQLLDKASFSADTLFAASLKLSASHIKQLYYRTTGDFYRYRRELDNYLTIADDLYKNQPCVDIGQLFESSKASAHEMLKEFNEAEKSWIKADEFMNNYYKCLDSLYPGQQYIHINQSPLYKARRYGLSALGDSLSIYQNKVYEFLNSFSYEGVLAEQMAGTLYANLGDVKYRDHYEKLVTHVTDIQDFSMATKPIAEYAYFLMRDKFHPEAYEQYEALFKNNIKWINDLVFTFGEQAFISYFNNYLKEGYDNYHSFVRWAKENEYKNLGELTGQAYDNLLLTKSIAFRSSAKKKKAFLQSSDTVTVALFNEWLQAKNRLINLYQQQQKSAAQGKPDVSQDELLKVQNEINTLENELAIKSVEFQKFIQVNEPQWQDVKKNLKENEAAIELVRFNLRDQIYYSDTSFYAAYIIKPESKFPEVIFLPSLADDLEGRYFKNYQNSIQYRLDDTVSYNQFWKPIQQKLHLVKKVFLSPDGIYHLISLPTLKNPATGEFLLDQIELEIITTTASIGKVINPTAKNTAVLLGRPAYSSELPSFDGSLSATRSAVMTLKNTVITDLPGTEDEILTLGNRLKENGYDILTYLSENATEDNLYKIDAPQILHIATHGFWSELDYNATPEFRTLHALMNSGLLLAGVSSYYNKDELPGGHDGLLTAYEAQQLNLNGTDLVVLSACETGLGKLEAGEGVYGLNRSFREAGAASIIITLWKVDDQATKEFMIIFYDSYLKNLNKHKAFVEAQQQIKNRFKDPYYWGAFVLVE